MEIKVEKSDYLNPEQKRIKADIMVFLMNDMFQTIANNESKLDPQAAVDIIMSCLMMFSREVLVHLLMNSNMLEHRSSLMDKFFDQIKSDVNAQIKDELSKAAK